MSDCRFRLLLVEDDEDDYLLTRDMLAEMKGMDYTLDWAVTYEAAVEAIGRQEHDVYLLDYHLGAHTGLELVREIVAAGAAAPGILLTGQGDRRIDVEAMQAGAADYLLKSEITPALLERAIRYALQHAQASAALQQSERRFRTLIHHSFDGIVMVGSTGIVQFVSPSMRTMLGYTEEELVGSSPAKLVHPDDLETIASAPDTLMEMPKKALHAEVRVRHSDGRYRWLEVVATNLLQEPGVGAVILNIRDSTERKQLEERLVHQALHDPLTDLPNYGALVKALTMDVARAARFQHHCAVLFLDIDHFKLINDTCGHQDGDAVLRAFAALIRTNLSSTDTIGRWGGEEFMAVLPETDLAAALVVAERLRLAVAAYSFPAGGGCRVTCSIGVAVFPEDGKSRADLISAADRAMYTAKRLGRDQVRAVSDPLSRSLVPAETDSLQARTGAALAALQHWLMRSPWSPADQSTILTTVSTLVGEIPEIVVSA